jgi:hypothetical protein
MDDDLNGMTREQLLDEVKRLRAGIRAHRDSSGHDLCWHHPQLWGLLPEPMSPDVAVRLGRSFCAGACVIGESLDRELPNASRLNAEHDEP